MSLLKDRRNMIDHQRRVTHAGEIRIAGEKLPNRPGKPLETFRLTSTNEQYLIAAAKVYGGEVQPWSTDGKPKGFQLFTTRKQIKAFFSTHEKPNGDLESLSLSYDLWSGDTHVRECDGCIVKHWVDSGKKNNKGKAIHEKVEAPCICKPDDPNFEPIRNQTCVQRARSSFILTEFPTLGLWHFLTGSETYTDEVLGLLDQIEQMGMMGQLIPVTLTITERTRRTGPQEDNEKFFVVKIEIDPQPVSLPELLAGVRQQALAMPADTFGATALGRSAPALAAPKPDNGLTEAQKNEAKKFMGVLSLTATEAQELKAKVAGAGLLFTEIVLKAKTEGVQDADDFAAFVNAEVSGVEQDEEETEVVEGELVEQEGLDMGDEGREEEYVP